MRMLLNLFHALPILFSIPTNGNALDPFYSDSYWKTLRDAYLGSNHGSYVAGYQPPIGLTLEITRLPHYRVSNATLAEGLQHLIALFEQQTQIPFPECLITPAAALSPMRITLDLNDISVLECMRFIGEKGGHFYSLMEDKLIFGRRPSEQINPWDRLQYYNLPISEALAFHWFSDSKKAWLKNESKPWNAGEFLADLGVSFPKGTRAEFIPSMNILACVHCDWVLPALQTLVAETEARLSIESALSKKTPLPHGMEIRTLEPAKSLQQPLSTVLARWGKYLVPHNATTSHVLRERGVQFPLGSSAWFDVSSSRLHVINTPEQLAMIERLNSNN